MKRDPERKERFAKIIGKVVEGTATDPLPPEWLAKLDRMPK